MYSLPVPSEQQRIPELLLWEQNYRWPLKPSFLELSGVSELNSDSQKLSALQQCWIFMKLSDLDWFGLSTVFLFGMGFLFGWLAFIVCLISFRLSLLRKREIGLQHCKPALPGTWKHPTNVLITFDHLSFPNDNFQPAFRNT